MRNPDSGALDDGTVDGERLAVLATLSDVLERLERSAVPIDAAQYRAVVARLARELAGVRPNAALYALFAARPAAAELYENLNYGHAGLCLRPLEAALGAEMAARQAIGRACGATRPGGSRRSDGASSAA
ncbi:MAG TPA: hypothetical protein VM491_21635 [Burkholderiaceae bacterium]|nr:hypothetical protein [Burkholderiaceae bacterium]